MDNVQYYVTSLPVKVKHKVIPVLNSLGTELQHFMVMVSTAPLILTLHSYMEVSC